MRIISYNTRGSLGMDDKRNTLRVSETLRPLCADVICFQEIHSRLPWSGKEDQPDVLSRQLGRRFYFHNCVQFGFGQYGIGIATRLPVEEVHHHPLPGGKEARGALELRLRNCAEIGKVSIFCTHWGLSEEERGLQAEALAEQIRLGPHPVIICGDFNEGPEGAAVTKLRTLAKLQDCAITPEPTYPADNPNVRIDYILCSEALICRQYETVYSLASDHLPIVADIETK